MSEIFYPVARLLGNPRVFFAISNALDGPDGETLKAAFYELIEYTFPDYEQAEDVEFEAEEACFHIDAETGVLQITLDTGLATVLQPIEGELKAHITNDTEMAATAAIYERLIKAICTANPDFTNNIALCSPPTPGNSYLRSEDGERFEGEFHLLSDPERQFEFNVDIIDVNHDILKATYSPKN